MTPFSRALRLANAPDGLLSQGLIPKQNQLPCQIREVSPNFHQIIGLGLKLKAAALLNVKLPCILIYRKREKPRKIVKIVKKG